MINLMFPASIYNFITFRSTSPHNIDYLQRANKPNVIQIIVTQTHSANIAQFARKHPFRPMALNISVSWYPCVKCYSPYAMDKSPTSGVRLSQTAVNCNISTSPHEYHVQSERPIPTSMTNTPIHTCRRRTQHLACFFCASHFPFSSPLVLRKRRSQVQAPETHTHIPQGKSELAEYTINSDQRRPEADSLSLRNGIWIGVGYGRW